MIPPSQGGFDTGYHWPLVAFVSSGFFEKEPKNLHIGKTSTSSFFFFLSFLLFAPALNAYHFYRWCAGYNLRMCHWKFLNLHIKNISDHTQLLPCCKANVPLTHPLTMSLLRMMQTLAIAHPNTLPHSFEYRRPTGACREQEGIEFIQAHGGEKEIQEDSQIPPPSLFMFFYITRKSE